MHTIQQRKIIEQMLKEGLLLLNSGVFEINEKKYNLTISIQEVCENRGR